MSSFIERNPSKEQKKSELDKKKKLTISEMAEINGTSRQTLIYYDKHKIFQPDLINEKGYRFYSPQSIPYLREIRFLKSIEIRLEDINTHIYNRNIYNTIDLLQHHKEHLEEEIASMQKKTEHISNRLNLYEKAIKHKNKIDKPYIEHFPERKICFFPWNNLDMSRSTLHITFMKAWIELERFGLCVENGWGAMLPSKNLQDGNILEGAGSYAYLPPGYEPDKAMQGIKDIPEGDYACLCKYGMPYEIKHVYYLLDWIEKNGYEITGEIYDDCFLDTTFYDQNQKVDFCQIQIQVIKKECNIKNSWDIFDK